MPQKAVFIIAQNNFHDTELLVPKGILDKRGLITKIASRTKETANGKLGAQLNPDLELKAVSPKDFDALVFVGGSGAREYLDDEAIFQLVREFQKQNKVLAAICLGPSILANAGALIGKIVTATPSQEENIKNRGGEYTGMPVEVDGRVITAKGPEAAREFGEKLAYLLEE
jgi:protease I